MSATWAAVIPVSSAHKLSRLRLERQLRCLPAQDHLWIRYTTVRPDIDVVLSSIAGVTRYRVTDLDELLHWDAGRVPVGVLPTGHWMPLSEFLTVVVPPAAFCGVTNERIPLRLVRSSTVKAATALLTDAKTFTGWAARAATVRLDRLTFAASSDRKIIVRGDPLPPVRGQRFTERSGVAVSEGFEWDPPVDGEIIRELVNAVRGDFVLLMNQSGATRTIVVASAHFVKGSRSAARLTLTGFRRGGGRQR